MRIRGLAPERVLGVIAAELGARLSSCDVRDPNLKSSETLECHFLRGGRRCRLAATSETLTFEVPVQSPVCLALGAPDRICAIDQRIKVTELGKIRVFLAGDSNRTFAGQVIQALLEELRALSISRREPLYVYKNAVRHLVLPANASLRKLDQVVDLAKKVERESKAEAEPPDFSVLPDIFNQLHPLISRWAVSDEAVRVQLIKDASDEELSDVVAKVTPYLSEINSYLDAFSDEPAPDEALLLGSLAELVSELMIR